MNQNTCPDAANLEGYDAAYANAPASANTYPAGSECHDAWEGGRLQGRKVIAECAAGC